VASPELGDRKTMGAKITSFESMIAPISLDEFFSTHWENMKYQAPLGEEAVDGFDSHDSSFPDT
jgi:hypothetical protein